MTVFKSTDVTWKGKTYTIKPTMDLLIQIEKKVSVVNLAASLSTEQPKLTHIAVVMGAMLRSAGAKVTDEDMFMELLYGDGESIGPLIQASMFVFVPAYQVLDEPVEAQE